MKLAANASCSIDGAWRSKTGSSNCSIIGGPSNAHQENRPTRASQLPPTLTLTLHNPLNGTNTIIRKQLKIHHHKTTKARHYCIREDNINPVNYPLSSHNDRDRMPSHVREKLEQQSLERIQQNRNEMVLYMFNYSFFFIVYFYCVFLVHINHFSMFPRVLV